MVRDRCFQVSSISRGLSLFPRALDDRGQALIGQQRNNHAEHGLEEGEGHVEADDRLLDALHGRDDRLVRLEDNLLGHDLVIDRIDDEDVGEGRADRHADGADKASDDRALAGLVVLIDQAGRQDEHRAEQEVGQLADACGVSSHQTQQVFDQADDNPIDRAEAEGTDQGRQVGDVQLDKAGHEGHREAQKSQDEGDGRQHRGHDQGADVYGFFGLCKHSAFPFRGDSPRQ